jgi:hypothetical protein
MFAERSNPEKVQEMLDDLERLRFEAASARQEFLESTLDDSCRTVS